MARRIDAVLIDDLTSANAAGYANVADIAHCTEFAFYVAFNHTSAAGTVLIETARSDDYAGVWAVLATVNWSAIDKTHYVAITGVVKSLRARISSAITSGKVTVEMVANIM